VTTIYKITNPSDRARARRPERVRHGLNRDATEQDNYPDAIAELALHIIARTG
jgi:hypothetical protein